MKQRVARSLTGIVVATVVAITGAAMGVPAQASPGSSAPVSGTRPLSCVPLLSTFQVVLPLPGLFLPLPSIKGLSEFKDLPAARQAWDLPTRVDHRDQNQGFNSYAEFVLRSGSIYTRPRNSGDTWRKVTTPACLDRHVVAISVDNNMLVALDRNGWIYSMDNVLSGPLLWNWTRLFGSPVWFWPGMQVPGQGRAGHKWAISHRMSKSFVDARGFTHPTTAGLVQLISLTGGGTRIVYQDPWLPADHSYEIGGPMGGRFISESVSSSGSVTFVTNRYGDMYTRKYDLDLAGSNEIPGRYTWQIQRRDKPSAPDQLQERFNPAFAAISLPAQEWQHVPKIPGEVTARISIHDSGPRMEDRELRVEGRRNGRTGFWRKGLSERVWRFTETGGRLADPILTGANPAVDQSTSTLAAPTGITFAGRLPGGWHARTDNFDWAQTSHSVTLTGPSGRRYQVTMHTTDGLRLVPRGPGLDNNPRTLAGALDVRSAQPGRSAELADFVRTTMSGRQIFEISVQLTTSRLVLSPAGFLTRPLGTWTRP
ncbi:hypothetical protein GII33_21610 [Gordonia pseudamarae]|jgi:hypothetical protein|uniref:Uncharacterized protein n=1 Tax=Gordonia pseudamarae TaxID=2831662 RepID=A0ABX6IMB7_9ACTN|nr:MULTISPECIES: hypothetical protein [Gordonia]MBD0022166.1 hypothetical protein [Gordonia sp. (in: high G+C Gram-positive bacteria)]QHN28183.1 hypothetical protein GII33_21610 [Gordonia pseudamarae]QHN37044.1 hypothetical protein GII31_21240 [Gordonia pseudamarae]